MLRVPKYRAGLFDPYREVLRKRRGEDPAVPVKHLFEEIKALGFTGCLNLLHKYINQGRADADRSHISPQARPDASHQARQPQGRASRPPGRAHRRLLPRWRNWPLASGTSPSS